MKESLKNKNIIYRKILPYKEKTRSSICSWDKGRDENSLIKKIGKISNIFSEFCLVCLKLNCQGIVR